MPKLLRLLPLLVAGLLLPATHVAASPSLTQHAARSTQRAAPADPVPPPREPAADRLYLGETGHVVQGGFLALWRSGGTAAFGYPLTEEFDATCDGAACTVQYFEKARFEYDPAGGRVAVGALGREHLAGRTFAPEPPFPSSPDRWHFPETGQALGFGFLRYWLTNDGRQRLGLPISPELSEEGRTVQYFERGRLDYFADREPAASIVVAPLGRAAVERLGWSLPATVEVALSAATVAQGRPLAIAVRGAREVGLDLAGEAVPASRAGDAWRGLAGVAPWAEPGDRALAATVIADDGTTRRLERSIRVAVFDFPRERFIVPPGQGDLLSPGVRERELATVQPLYRIVTPEPLWRGAWRWPVTGPITTEFATRRAYNDGPYSEYHGGVDIGAAAGTPVVAPAAGRVVYAGPLAIRGNFIAIDHGLGLLTTYFHLSAIEVGAGESVQPGQQIGRVGSTGLSSGPHLHWEARIGGTPVEPRAWLTDPLFP
jgi:murein DD-endopeptidase MepM/ murein hydrolase activator NlpD